MSRLVVVGSLNSDLTVPVDHLPGPGETVMATAPAHVGFGGKGGNQACAAAAIGGAVAMVARVGDDEAGTVTRADLRQRGVDTALVLTTAGVRTGSAVIIVDRGGDNSIVVDAGANATLGPGDVANPTVAEAEVVLVQLEIPLAAVGAAVRAATGIVVLNPAPAAPLDDAVLSRVDVLVPNQIELGRLTASPPPRDLPATLRLVGALPFAFDVVVTLGAGGALVVPRPPGEPVFLPAPRVDAIDATGAGDVFCGALGVALADGRPLAEAASLAVAAASLSTTARGARGLLPTRPQTEALAASLHAQPITDRA
jgi:ribokinase